MTPNDVVNGARYILLPSCALAIWLLLGPFELENGLDKAVHAGAFYAFALAALFCMPWSRQGEVLLATLLIAISSEAAQAATGRNASMLDCGANLTGVAVAAIPFYVARFRAVAQQGRYVPLITMRRLDRRSPSRGRFAPRTGRERDLDRL